MQGGHRLSGMLLFMVWSLWSSAAFADSKPELTAYTAEYRLSYGSFGTAIARYQLKPLQDGRWQFSSTAKVDSWVRMIYDDSLSELSIFRFDNNKIIPLRYESRHDNGDKVRVETVDFDWPNKQANIQTRKGAKVVIAVAEGTLDKMLLQLALRQMLINGEHNSDYTFSFVNGKKVKTYTLNIQGDETTTTPAGSYPTIRAGWLDDKGRRTTFWLAAQLDYVPVRVEHVDPGKPALSLKLLKYQAR